MMQRVQCERANSSYGESFCLYHTASLQILQGFDRKALFLYNEPMNVYLGADHAGLKPTAWLQRAIQRGVPAERKESHRYEREVRTAVFIV